jgi:predicted phage terminase large subunit-like protein
MINVPPRMMKSTLCSVIWPVWEWIEHPEMQFLTASYAIQLSTRDALKSRRLIESDWFQANWGRRFNLLSDESAKRTYSNNRGGKRISTSTDAATTGEGGNRIIVDDPHNAKESESEAIIEATTDWWDSSMSSRLNQPEQDSWMVIGQRTAVNDLFGHIMKTDDMSKIVHLVLPNEFKKESRCVTRIPDTGELLFKDPRTVEGELLNPIRLSKESSVRLKKLMEHKYHLQYQQDEKAGDGALLKRTYWKKWEGEPPEVDEIITFYDTALEEGEDNDYSARTTWGLFKHREMQEREKLHPKTGKPIIDPATGLSVKERYMGQEETYAILIGAWRDKVPFHELRKIAKEHNLKIKPDHTYIEKKGSGISLLQEFRKAGVRVKAVKLDHGGRVKVDKVTRAHLAVVPLAGGRVFYMDRSWAQDVIDECAAFPNGEHDDYVDTCLMAWMLMRRRGEIGDWEDEKDDEVRLYKPKKKSIYG